MSKYPESHYATSMYSHDTYASMKDPTQSKPSQRWEEIGRFIWNSDEKKFLGRTGISWILIIAYLSVFYAVLVGLFAGMLTLFLRFVISNDEPYRTGYQSRLKMEPGLGMRPIPDFRTNLIAYSATDPQSYLLYTQNMQSFLNTYEFSRQVTDDAYATCNPHTGAKSPNDPKKVCRFDLKELGPCQKENMYGYRNRRPCIILKLNKVYGWIPSSYMSSDVLVQCAGKHQIETELLGEIKYYPSRTINGTTYGMFSHVFFPYLSQVGYRPPLVAVEFPSLTKNVVMLVSCRIVGMHGATLPVTFELLYD